MPLVGKKKCLNYIETHLQNVFPFAKKRLIKANKSLKTKTLKTIFFTTPFIARTEYTFAFFWVFDPGGPKDLWLRLNIDWEAEETKMLARTVVGLIALLLMAVAYFVTGHELCDSARVLWHGTPWKLLLEALDPGLLRQKTGTGGASGFIHSVPLYSSLSYWEERTLFSCGLVPTGCALMHHLCAAAAGVRHHHRRQLPLHCFPAPGDACNRLTRSIMREHNATYFVRQMIWPTSGGRNTSKKSLLHYFLLLWPLNMRSWRENYDVFLP